MKQSLTYLIILLLAITLLVSCAPYPKYKKYNPNTPQRISETPPALTTNSYLRLGFILQTYLGKPYMGRSKYREGVDCSMFVREVYREFNDTLILPRTVRDQFMAGTDVPRRRMQFGDLVFFETIRGRASHVGIYVGYNQFIHASSSRGVIISRLEDKYWSPKLMGIRRMIK